MKFLKKAKEIAGKIAGKAMVQFIRAFQHKFADIEVVLTYTCKNRIRASFTRQIWA